MNRNKVLIILGLIVITSPIIISQLLRVPTGKWTIGDENAWIGFFGGYIGVIIGGLVTYLVFWQTIQHYREKDKQDSLHNEELKRLAVRPYLAVKIVGKDDRDDDSFHVVHFFIIGFSGEYKMRYCKFQLENVGSGTALDINFPYFHGCSSNPELNNLVCKVGEQLFIDVRSQVIDHRTGTEFFSIEYYDLSGNKYKQFVSVNNSVADKYGDVYLTVDHTSIPDLIKE